MAEMTEAELSLAVARIMYPEYEWKMRYKDGDCIVSGRAMGGIRCKSFDYQSKGCSWDMAVWLANQDNSDIGSYPSLIMSEIITEENSQHAMAMAILELGGEKL